MAKGIRELQPINEGGVNLTETVLFEGVTDTPDNEGILARKVTIAQLEDFLDRATGDIAVSIGSAVQAEQNRAEEEEAAIRDEFAAADTAITTDIAAVRDEFAEEDTAIRGEITAAVTAEQQRALEAESLKANIVISSQPVTTAGHGDQLRLIKFQTWIAPMLPLIDGTIELSDGAVIQYDATAGRLYYVKDAVETDFYANGAWQRNTFNTGLASVDNTFNADTGIWRNVRWGSADYDLVDLRDLAIDAKIKAGNALDGVLSANTKNNEQDVQIAELETDIAGIATQISTAVSTHNTDTNAHSSIQQAITDLAAQIPTPPPPPAVPGLYLVEVTASGNIAYKSFLTPPPGEGKYVIVVDDAGNFGYEPPAYKKTGYDFDDAAEATAAIIADPAIETHGNIILLQDSQTLHMYTDQGWLPALQ